MNELIIIMLLITIANIFITFGVALYVKSKSKPTSKPKKEVNEAEAACTHETTMSLNGTECKLCYDCREVIDN